MAQGPEEHIWDGEQEREKKQYLCAIERQALEERLREYVENLIR